MKIGLFADIHGNIYAFQKVWKALKNESCDRYFFLGDICGYYYHQNEIIEVLIGNRNIHCILGNHDDLFLRMQEDEQLEKRYTSKYGRSCELLKKRVTKESIRFLKGLAGKYIFAEERIAFFHGAPWNNLEGYVYPDDSLRRFEPLLYRWVILGHTHYPMNRKAGQVRVVNPGSSGQPRDGKDPSYALLDTETDTIEFKRVHYDCSPLIRDIKSNKESNAYLCNILKKTGNK